MYLAVKAHRPDIGGRSHCVTARIAHSHRGTYVPPHKVIEALPAHDAGGVATASVFSLQGSYGSSIQICECLTLFTCLPRNVSNPNKTQVHNEYSIQT